MTRHSPFNFAETPASPRAKLHSLMGEIVELEEQLAAARSRYSAAVEKTGQDTAGIFAECSFS
jgi:hypothetical protein